MYRFEFYVDTAEIDGDFLRIAGKVYAGDIPLGFHFTGLRRGDEHYPLDLVVNRIVTYRRDVDELNRAMTGYLYVSGGLTLDIRPDDMLCG